MLAKSSGRALEMESPPCRQVLAVLHQRRADCCSSHMVFCQKSGRSCKAVESAAVGHQLKAASEASLVLDWADVSENAVSGRCDMLRGRVAQELSHLPHGRQSRKPSVLQKACERVRRPTTKVLDHLKKEQRTDMLACLLPLRGGLPIPIRRPPLRKECEVDRCDSLMASGSVANQTTTQQHVHR